MRRTIRWGVFHLHGLSGRVMGRVQLTTAYDQGTLASCCSRAPRAVSQSSRLLSLQAALRACQGAGGIAARGRLVYRICKHPHIFRRHTYRYEQVHSMDLEQAEDCYKVSRKMGLTEPYIRRV